MAIQSITSHVRQKIPVQIIAGFLGAGKTTLLQHLFTQKPAEERWVVLMNEFGQIGIDQYLLNNEQGIQVQEVVGGCLCCSSQLPMQQALQQIIRQMQPDRIWIEPSGLGHPLTLLEQLLEPYWQPHLAMQAMVWLVNGCRLHEAKWQEKISEDVALQAAQIIIATHADQMQADDLQAWQALQQEHQQFQQHWWLSDGTNIQLEQLQVAYHSHKRAARPLLSLQQQASEQGQGTLPDVRQYPYFYHEQRQGVYLYGWKFTRRWQFDFEQVFDLCAKVEFLRLKAILYCDTGWVYLNCNPQAMNYTLGMENVDNRLEIIAEQEIDALAFEQALLNALRVSDAI
ncbi:MAG: GTP-binding protein [Acinetobacter sp.]|nr:GTP-binding protein [Acinetobacter sp.]